MAPCYEAQSDFCIYLITNPNPATEMNSDNQKCMFIITLTYPLGEPRRRLSREEEYTKQGRGANRKDLDSEHGKRANEPTRYHKSVVLQICCQPK
ncbi:MAG: hypothetical protein BECKG1743D_GA0114223_105073 [Candidatus Kentron sp. G]|nr:MAG: hypothetical protein BECKG1743F_GA0114225_104953 [Candidatus Kentron sp. G]VFN03722.1 MAG: hypothetical protein BECKG1743D_GA0114223_105073 [Candidatus Kentron sp. G]VFN05202.1 MAG: hypothetical protein BECKG1743E_GA0114224_108321 [Candidatus Kentron sp. G]